MKIAYLTHQYFPHSVGGVEVYTQGLARRAAARGDDVRIITYHESPHGTPTHYGRRYTQVDDIPVIEIHYNLSTAPLPAQAEYNNDFTAQQVCEELVEFQPDIVHVMHAMKLSGSVLEVCYALDLPVIVTLADYWLICPRHTLLKWDGSLCEGPKHRLYCVHCLQQTHGFATSPAHHRHFWQDIQAISRRNNYLREMMRHADRIIALSHFQKAMFLQNGYSQHQIDVIEHGLEVDGLTPPSQLPDKPTILFIGSIVPHKGLHILLEAFVQSPDLPFELHIYGDTSRLTPYVEKVKSLSAGDSRVSWKGTFPIEQQGQVLNGASVLAMPALWYENSPLVVKAALHLGIPVIASRIGTLIEMIVSPEVGWLVAPGDIQAWKEALYRVDYSRRRAHPMKSMDEHASEIFMLYREVIHDANTSG
jgi:glycosyltransferase involved in cell wall biosynthesis